MLLLIFLLFGLFLITIPLSLLKIYNTSVNNAFSQTKTSIKLLFSFFVYLLMSFIIPLMMLLVVVGPDPRPNRAIPFENKLICLVLVLVYGFVGWLLNSFVNGKFIKSWRAFSFYEEKPKSIFDSK